jgi:tetratricopeptide (TPR) repeat protein
MKENSNRDIHIDAIRRRFGITLAAVSEYNSLNREEIKNSDEIFNLNNGGRERMLALLYMVSPDGQDSVIRKFREKTGMDDAQYNVPCPLIEKYGTMLAAAMIYNPHFYAMAVNYHGIVSAGLPVTWFPVTDERPIHIEKKSYGRIIPFPLTSRLVLAAAAVFAVIFFITVLIRTGGITGRRINNDWIAGLSAPQKAHDGIAFVSGDDGTRIGIKSPLVGIAMSADNKASDLSTTASYYTRVIRKETDNAVLYVNRGIAYTMQGYIDYAIKDFDKAVELEPNNTSAYFNRAVAYAGKGNDGIESAIADLITIIDINPGDNEAYYALGVLYFRQYENDNAKPKALLEKAINVFSQIQGYRDADIIFDYLSRLL